MYRDQELIVRPITKKDLETLWALTYKDENLEWKKWDAPYYPHSPMSFETFLIKKANWIDAKDIWAIEVNGFVCGTVSYYWEHEPSYWLEMGIVIYTPQDWGKSIGTRALKIWIDHLFSTLPLVRVGFTTWSGNERMIKTGLRLGMKEEARIRKVRLYNGVFYDSIRMGLLREEWEATNNPFKSEG